MSTVPPGWTVRLTTEWACEVVAGPSLAAVRQRLDRAIADGDDMAISEALTGAWMLGARDAAVEYTAQLIDVGSPVQLVLGFDLPGDAAPGS